MRKRKNKWIEQLRSPERWRNTEQARIIRTNILNIENEEKLVLMVVSPEENEQQPIISSKLAGSFTEIGKKVLLVDVNFRNPTLYSLFDIANEPGISDVLSGKAVSVHEAFIRNLHVLPVGCSSLPLEGLSTIDQVIIEWQFYYDIIIIVAPPFLEVADSQILSSVCNGVILLIQESRTKKMDVLQIKKTLERTGVHIVGAIYQTG